MATYLDRLGDFMLRKDVAEFTAATYAFFAFVHGRPFIELRRDLRVPLDRLSPVLTLQIAEAIDRARRRLCDNRQTVRTLLKLLGHRDPGAPFEAARKASERAKERAAKRAPRARERPSSRDAGRERG